MEIEREMERKEKDVENCGWMNPRIEKSCDDYDVSVKHMIHCTTKTAEIKKV